MCVRLNLTNRHVSDVHLIQRIAGTRDKLLENKLRETAVSKTNNLLKRQMSRPRRNVL